MLPSSRVTTVQLPELLAPDSARSGCTRSRPIGPDDTSVEVEGDLAEMGGDLLVRVVDQMAAGTAVETPQPRFQVEGLAAGNRLLPCSEHALAIRAVHEGAAFEPLGKCPEGQAEEVQPLGIHVFEGAILAATPHGVRQSLREDAEIGAAVRAPLHGPRPF